MERLNNHVFDGIIKAGMALMPPMIKLRRGVVSPPIS